MTTEPTKKWTRGPWSVFGRRTIRSGDDGIADVHYRNRDANAHLIAAAPLMYDMLSNLEIVSHEDEIKIAAILAEARGETL